MQVMARWSIILAVVIPLMSCSAPALGPQGQAGNDRLNDLFTRLHGAANTQEASHIQAEILHAWARSGSPALDRRLIEAVGTLQRGQPRRAITILDEVVQRKPDFVEAWNQRAIAHALADDYGGAMLDLRQVLVLEPRHFAALAGLGHIFQTLGYETSALEAYDAALALNPHLLMIRERANALREKLAGVPA